MSIYATLWQLKFPRYGDDHTDCEWIDVIAQGVLAHIGTPTPGCGYETGDPYFAFLPPAVEVAPDDDGAALRAVVFVTVGTAKGTGRSGQEYVDPLLVLSGRAYAALSFGELYERLCTALRGHRPRVVLEQWNPDGSVRLVFEDGRIEDVRRKPNS
jgi:hypothetical protein